MRQHKIHVGLNVWLHHIGTSHSYTNERHNHVIKPTVFSVGRLITLVIACRFPRSSAVRRSHHLRHNHWLPNMPRVCRHLCNPCLFYTENPVIIPLISKEDHQAHHHVPLRQPHSVVWVATVCLVKLRQDTATARIPSTTPYTQ